ncbi:MAG: two-component regulator propeller domain-containing protein [Cytophagaceae bacterium]
MPIGSWRAHLPYSEITGLEIANDKIFGISNNISFFYLDTKDNSIHTLSKSDGLTEMGITRMKYNEKYKLLLVSYQSGNIDLIYENNIINIPDIARNSMPGSKIINHIMFHDKFAFLSADFGLVKLDLEKKEIGETYSDLGPGGSKIKIYGSTLTEDKDSLFIATEAGVFAAKFSQVVNLMDFNNWTRISDGMPITRIASVNNFNGLIYAGITNNGFYYLANGVWEKLSFTPGVIHNVEKSKNKLVICLDTSLVLLHSRDSFEIFSGHPYFKPRDAKYDNKGNLWLADIVTGLVKIDSEGKITGYRPEGPWSNRVFNLNYTNGMLIVCAGGYNHIFNPLYSQGNYFIYKEGKWFNNPTHVPSIDLMASAYLPSSKKLYLASFGHGVFEVNPDNTVIKYNEMNSPLKTPYGTSGSGDVRISHLTSDSKGNIWIANYLTSSMTEPSVHVIKPDGTWDSFTFLNPADPATSSKNRYPVKILIDDYNQKWVRLDTRYGNGIFVFNDNKTFKYLGSAEGKGKLPDEKVTAIAKDKNGDIWVGTTQGIAVFYNTADVLKNVPVNAVTPIYNRYPLLNTEHITCIAIDGGNRKWIGTTTGVWLFNKDATEVIYRFTEQNSPLLANHITDIAIDDQTGEVYIGTTKGLVSFRGTATESGGDFSNVIAFPNPVKPDFEGTVGITGLATDAIVKITDINGTLVYETRANGGTAVWNARDYNGVRAKTGVYLVFMATEDGEKKLVTKIAVVN